MRSSEFRKALDRLKYGDEDAVEVFDQRTGERLYLIREEDLKRLADRANVDLKPTTHIAA